MFTVQFKLCFRDSEWKVLSEHPSFAYARTVAEHRWRNVAAVKVCDSDGVAVWPSPTFNTDAGSLSATLSRH
ncbi:hypothetical protein VRRI112168_03735 [Vreelandella rituensis]|uniref:hypothetical protein n=1 Tax=Vreelandella rituensis TaxID=2282306 RepID=UPI001C699E9C|nr:hypothetical protein [Halomonas rituensis]